MPGFQYHGKPLVYYGERKRHPALYGETRMSSQIFMQALQTVAYVLPYCLAMSASNQ